jgi:aryl-alcohol dehydrogenase-like predicted oxidoreductase
MKLRQLGNSDLHVSEISFGTWLTTSGGVERDRAIACIHRSFDVGINFIDTANVYGRGASETVVGEALAGMARDSYVLATKVYFPMSDTDRGLSRAQILKQIDDSLRRLRTDHVDLYQCHRYDTETPLEETMTALTEIVRAGKARYLGFSEWPVEKVEEAAALPNVERFVSSQPQYSMLWPTPDDALIPLCARSGISQIVWSPLAQGILTGKYKPGAEIPADSRAAQESMNMHFRRQWLERPVLEAVEKIGAIAARADMSLTQFALAWVLREPNVASAIIGASRPEQVDENAAASGRDVPAELFAEAEALLAPVR